MDKSTAKYNLTPFLYRFGDKLNHGWSASAEDFFYRIVNEVQDILSTRCGFAMRDEKTIYSTLNYGIPDLGAMTKSDDTSGIAQQIKRALEALEPRLSHVSIDIEIDKSKVFHIIIRSQISSPINEMRNIVVHVYNDGRMETEAQ